MTTIMMIVLMAIPKPALADKEIYLSGVLREPLKWEVIKELRDIGYEVTTKSKKSVPKLRVRISRIGYLIVCDATLYQQDGRVVSQGRGESKYFYFRVSGRYSQMFREKLRYKAESEAAREAINSLLP